MKVLICPDKFKESLSSKQAAECIERGILKAYMNAECHLVPMADGGEGTVDALVSATNGRLEKVRVHDPLMRPVNSFFGITGEGSTAVIEMAAASGLALLDLRERNPMVTTTYGTGELILKAIDKGCEQIIVGIGGSATVDGGVGMAQALGVSFKDEKGKEIKPGGGYLRSIHTIDTSGIDKRIRRCKITVASDVTNVLTGSEGAAFVFGGQKGANSDQIRTLDENLNHLAGKLKDQLNTDVSALKGGGAAGGLGAGIAAFLGGNIKKGFEVIADIVGLEKQIQQSDLVITGEGKMDHQTAYGKTPAGVADIALRYHKPVIAFTGALDDDFEKLYQIGFKAVVPISDRPMSLEESMTHAGLLLESAAERAFRLILTGENLVKK